MGKSLTCQGKSVYTLFRDGIHRPRKSLTARQFGVYTPFDFICFSITAIIAYKDKEAIAMMELVSCRFPREVVASVREYARVHKIDISQAWRDLVHMGLRKTEPEDELSKTTLNFAVQSLCLSRRIAGHLDEELIIRSKEDAIRTLEKLTGDDQ